MADSKKLMGLSVGELQALGISSGLAFTDATSKPKMVQQLLQHEASGWMEVNRELMSESETGYDDMPGFSGSSNQLSDSAHIAQMINSAGFGGAFHHAMGAGEQHHVEAINEYMTRLGANTQDVWMHLPKDNPDAHPQAWGTLNSYLRDTLSDNQDIMPKLAGHYAGDIMSEYATNKGDVSSSYESLAHIYLDKTAYTDHEAYNNDVAKTAMRLASQMGGGFIEVAATTAMGGKASYMDLLPQIGDPSISSHVQHPREALNAAGLPLGSSGSAVSGRSQYSLTASLTGMPEQRGGIGESIYKSISADVRDLARPYKGGADVGMNPYTHRTSEYDMVMDSATRYVGVEDARSGYNNLDETSYSASTVRNVIENTYDRMDAQQNSIASIPSSIHAPKSSGTGFSANFDNPTDYNSARSRRESIAIADLDASYAPEPSPVTYHRDIKQGTDEWLSMRENYDITGSTVGTLLGNGSYTTMQKRVAELEGLYPSSREVNSEFSKRMFAAGHKSEAAARPRVEQEFGINIEEVGAITNSNFPNMMYSPDGLIGDDALWEHKNPNITKRYANLGAGEHQDYLDQMQLGMHLSGRSRTLFSQTVGNNTKSEWIDADPTWYEKNKDQLDSIAGRRASVRSYIDENQDDYDAAMSATDDEKERRKIRNRFNRGAQKAAKGDASNFINESPDYSSVATDSSQSQDSMALSVKTGIILANEEMKQKNAAGGFGGGGSGGGEDADFDDLGMPRGFSRSRFNNANSDGSGGGKPPPPIDLFGGAFGSIANGIAGGSMASARGGFMGALKEGGPVGQSIALGIGALGIGGEILSTMSDYRGAAEDAGMTNGIQFDSMSQGLEMMGLNEGQARALNQRTHSDYNRLENGDPSGVIRIATGTRGLLSVSDVREAEGDPVRLASIFRERAEARGWSQSRIAGAAEMAGLDGFARVATRTDRTVDAAQGMVDTRGREDVSEFNEHAEIGQGVRAIASPTYNMPRLTAENYGTIAPPIYGTMAAGYNGLSNAGSAIGNGYDGLVGAVRQLESGGNDFDANGNPITSKTGAKYSMQVLPSTASDPGYGIQPAQNDSADEYNRVGREYQLKMLELTGDPRKAAAAYTDGLSTVNKAVERGGDDWLNFVPQQAQKRVADLEKMGVFSGADRFAQSGGMVAPVINVDIRANVNGREATATVQATGAQTVTQVVNMGHGSVQRR